MVSINSVQGVVAPGGLAGVNSRIAAIRTRLDGFTGTVRAMAPVTDAMPGIAYQADASAARQATPPPPPSPPGLVAALGSAPTAAVGGVASGTGFAPSGLASTATGSALAAKLPAHAQPWVSAIEAAASEAGVDPALLAALVKHESNFNPDAVSRAGALGLAQLMPGTAAGLGVDPKDPGQNLAGGARYLRSMLERFGSVDLALAAYNAGPNRVAQAGGVPRIQETVRYVGAVMTTWEQLR